ncbi:MAG: hypothetical protein KDD62_13930, partial [Bdellovibrionales bacterium]|nr:hypothetical protein [Bdellovibrionales bacterium]
MSTKEVMVQVRSKQEAGIPEVWLRISAFLELKADHTQRTYLGVIKEWCQFLGAEAGTPKAAHLMVA